MLRQKPLTTLLLQLPMLLMLPRKPLTMPWKRLKKPLQTLPMQLKMQLTRLPKRCRTKNRNNRFSIRIKIGPLHQERPF